MPTVMHTQKPNTATLRPSDPPDNRAANPPRPTPIAIRGDEESPGSRCCLEERLESLGVELVVAEVEGCIDGLERFKVDGHFLLLVLLCKDCTAVHNQTKFGDTVVQFEALLGRFDRREHREAVDAGLNVLRCTELIAKHLLGASDIVFWRQDERDHRGTVPARRARRQEEGGGVAPYQPHWGCETGFRKGGVQHGDKQGDDRVHQLVQELDTPHSTDAWA